MLLLLARLLSKGEREDSMERIVSHFGAALMQEGIIMASDQRGADSISGHERILGSGTLVIRDRPIEKSLIENQSPHLMRCIDGVARSDHRKRESPVLDAPAVAIPVALIPSQQKSTVKCKPGYTDFIRFSAHRSNPPLIITLSLVRLSLTPLMSSSAPSVRSCPH